MARGIAICTLDNIVEEFIMTVRRDCPECSSVHTADSDICPGCQHVALLKKAIPAISPEDLKKARRLASPEYLHFCNELVAKYGEIIPKGKTTR